MFYAGRFGVLVCLLACFAARTTQGTYSGVLSFVDLVICVYVAVVQETKHHDGFEAFCCAVVVRAVAWGDEWRLAKQQHKPEPRVYVNT